VGTGVTVTLEFVDGQLVPATGHEVLFVEGIVR
jgi:hypothetical protein